MKSACAGRGGPQASLFSDAAWLSCSRSSRLLNVGRRPPEGPSRKRQHEGDEIGNLLVFCGANTGPLQNRPAIDGSIVRNPNPLRFESCVVSKPTFLYRFRSCGIFK